ncbi:dehydratase small subunit [Thermovirga lienii DSM 17291]|uniref:Dehydratase small subunit n=1 Tax=Thermovirga lienii (strain ATCC BAA-1197 / DSM 17291 / Cas60314) TaxID=580340 RepID=G7V6B3_THELD|nr:diol dehydratase small subunit [Thermovirga lienii]AER65942.1 dehydratase small subunit [Thermovirga lienii DSM 17291]
MAMELNEQLIAELVRKTLKEVMGSANAPTDATPTGEKSKNNLKVEDYPLASKRPELLKTPTGKAIEDVNLDNLLSGKVGFEDLRITPEALEYQAQIAEAAGKEQVAMNLRRSAELIKVPDKRLLEIYNALRPRRSTKQELLDIADELESKYNAVVNARMVREAADVYERRGLLKSA